MDIGRMLPQQWQRSRAGRTDEPGAAMFLALRLRLTLWYCGVLAAALLLFGLALYIGVQQVLFTSVRADLAARIPTNIQQPSGPPNVLCTLPTHDGGQGGGGTTVLTVSYNQSGVVLHSDGGMQLPSAFLSNTLVQDALAHGTATDIVDSNSSFGHIYRFARAVPDPDYPGHMYVFQAGESVQMQMTELNILLLLLLIVGAIVLVGAGLGGLFLANRALAPTRLAFNRQRRFIADASHELRTPLTLMRADAEVLLRGRERLDEEDAMLLEDIVSEAEHMTTLTTNMLTLARLDDHSQHREQEVVNLTEVAQAVVQRVKAFAEQSGVTVETENSGDMPLVIGDHALLEQATLVLTDNAIKYNRPDGRVTVRTSTNKGYAQLEVRDTGIGISAEHLSHLGERFYRVDKARSRAIGGTGLGISIAHSIAATHGGTLTLNSVPDEGTTAKLSLPLAQNTQYGRRTGELSGMR